MLQVAGIQAPGGTGALKLAALFLHAQLGYDTVYVSKPTWGKAIHHFVDMRFEFFSKNYQ